MAFMTPEITAKQDWAGVETSAGFWWIPFDVLTKSEAESARRGEFEPLLKYTEGNRVYDSNSSIKSGYGVRLSARGYMDATDWEVYGSKKEAIKRGRELARESEGEDYATKKKSFTRATKKSPAQLDREIDEVLGRKHGGRAHSTIATRDYEYVVYPEPSHRHAERTVKVPYRKGRGPYDLTDAKRVAKEMGPPAAIYSVSKGAFVGYIHGNGRFVPFR